MPTGDIEVVYIAGRWLVRYQGESHEFGRYRLKVMAEAVGRAFARSFGAELIVKKRNGRIGHRDTYGNDPGSIPG